MSYSHIYIYIYIYIYINIERERDGGWMGRVMSLNYLELETNPSRNTHEYIE